MKGALRCHNHEPSNLLFAIQGRSIFVRCSNRNCERWHKVTLTNAPDLDTFGVTQEMLPANYRLDLKEAAVIERSHG